MSRRGKNIYQRKDGRWEGRYYCKGSGSKYKSVYGRTYTEAKEKLDKLRSEVFIPSRTCVFRVSDILQMWLESRRTRIKESSFASYHHKVNTQILPYFGEMKYSKLGSAQLEKFISDKLSAGLSAKYVADMVIMIKSAAKWAEITHNYANFIRNVELPKANKAETQTFSVTEQKRIIKTVNEERTPTACGVMLTMYSGLRIGELCALQWKDIDFTTGILHINKTIQRIAVFGDRSKTAVKITSPKSATSIRDIPLPEFLLAELRKYKASDNDYVVSGCEKIVEPRSFTNRYKALLKKANVPSLKFHALRHTFATNALQMSFDVKTLSEILGHSNAVITMRVYVHSSMERKSACMNRLQALV